MKRKGSKRVSKVDEDENGVEETQENGRSEEPKEKRGRKSKGKKSKHESDESDDEVLSKSQTKSAAVETDPLAGDNNEEEEPEEEYEVEAILDDKMVKGVRHFLIRWKGYTEESDTWEPEDTLQCTYLLKEYKDKPKKEKKVGRKKSGEKKKEEEEEKWDENEDFEVDRIIDVYFHKNGKRDFLVSWKGYPASQNSWEPEDNMDCKDLIKKFMEKVEAAKNVEAVDTKLRVVRKPVNRLAFSMYEHSRKLSRRHRGKERVRYFDAE